MGRVGLFVGGQTEIDEQTGDRQPRRGDLLRWAATTYRVETVEPDPLGLTCRLGLARTA